MSQQLLLAFTTFALLASYSEQTSEPELVDDAAFSEALSAGILLFNSATF